MKKVFIIIGSVLGTLILIVIGLAIYLGVNISDNTNDTNSQIVEDNIDTATLMDAYLYETMDSADTENPGFLLSEEEMNYLLYSFVPSIHIPSVSVKSIYCKYGENGKFNVYAPSTALGFTTCVKATAMATEEDGIFKVIVNNISIGNFGTDNWMVKTFVLGNLKLSDYAKALEEYHVYLNMEYTGTQFIITIDKDDITRMVDNLVNDNNKYLYEALVSELIGSEKYLSFDFNDDGNIGVIVLLNTLKYNETFSYDLRSDISTIKNQMTILMNNNICNAENKNVIFDYLVRGYEAIGEENQKMINGLNFSSIGIKYNAFYEGVTKKSSITMTDVFDSFIELDPLKYVKYTLLDYYDVTITESQLDEILNGLDFIGTSFCFKKENKVSYITIESLKTEVSDDSLELYLIVDIDGTLVYAKVRGITSKSNDYSITLSVDSLTLGKEETKAETKAYLLKYLETSINVDFISVDAENSKITLDFSNYVKDDFFTFIIKTKLDKNKIILSSQNEGQIILRLYD